MLNRTLAAFAVVALTALALVACPSSSPAQPTSAPSSTPTSAPAPKPAEPKGTDAAEPPGPGLSVATFAGGCFWCMEPPFEKLKGVKAVLSGYTGGAEASPHYKQVAYGRTGHTEAVRVIYDPNAVSYERLLDVYWRNINPTDIGGQFADRGKQYRPTIFAHTPAQREAALKSRAALDASKRFSGPVVVPVEDAGVFWVAEEYHQDFYKKDPNHYKRYRRGSGREDFIDRHWSDDE